MWLNFDVWLPIVRLKPIWRKRYVIVPSVVCAARILRSDCMLSEADLTLARAVEIAQSMDAAHKNAQALKGPELPVRRLERLPRERGKVERKARGRKPCYRCGQRGHLPHECGFKEATCHKCKKKGHIAKACRSARNSAHQGSAKWVETQAPKQVDNDETVLICQVGSHTSPPYEVVVTLNGKPVTMEIDTGAAVSIMSNQTKKALFPSEVLNKPTLNLRTFTSEPIPVLGQLTVEVRYGTYVGTHPLYVVKGSGPTLLGRDWLRDVRLDWLSIRTLTAHNCLLTLNQLTEKYAEVFQPELGTFKTFQAQLQLKGARPIFLRPCSVPFALKESVERELERLEQNGTLCYVEHSE